MRIICTVQPYPFHERDECVVSRSVILLIPVQWLFWSNECWYLNISTLSKLNKTTRDKTISRFVKIVSKLLHIV